MHSLYVVIPVVYTMGLSCQPVVNIFFAHMTTMQLICNRDDASEPFMFLLLWSLTEILWMDGWPYLLFPSAENLQIFPQICFQVHIFLWYWSFHYYGGPYDLLSLICNPILLSPKSGWWTIFYGPFESNYMNVVQFIGSDQFWAYNKNVCIL